MTLQQRLLSRLPKKLRGLAGFGFQALVLTPFTSCNANARMAAAQRQAGEMRMYRLLRNTHLAQLLRIQIQRGLPLNSGSILNVNFSNFGGVAVLVAALQTNKGRALPWTLEALPSNIQGVPLHTLGYDRRKAAYHQWKQTTGGDQFDIVLRLVKQIDEASGQQPGLVFDRGFGNKRLLSALFARSGHGYIRMRDDFRVTVEGSMKWRYIRDLPIGDYRVSWQGLSFRLVVATTGRSKTYVPWAIATNDTSSTPQHITKLYYHRFEIEETFRDWKSGLGLRRARFLRWQSLEVVLSFASAGILFAWLLTKSQMGVRNHPNKQLSFFREWYETLQYRVRLREPTTLTGGCVYV